jgi:hypothetical protein
MVKALIRRTSILFFVLVGLLTGACAGESRVPGRQPEPTSTAVTPPAPRSPTPTQPIYRGSIAPIDQSTRARMTSSWREGCPVPVEDLRLLAMSFWGYDRRVHTGEMVVHRDVARDVVKVFRRLFDERFPIRRMRLVDEYGGDDDRSMAANNTSGFNCRDRAGSPGVWSEHAFGRAIDVNPLVNPYVAADGFVDPPEGRSYTDRSRNDRGMIHPGDVVVEAFASIGWEWGGDWASVKDYQHFSENGR